MAYLLDTHTLLWFVAGDKQLPESSKEIIKNVNESCFLSATSLWEITIKHQLKKLELGISLEELFEFVERNQIEIIPINSLHLLQLSKLPFYHHDPFDRMIIAQAISENLKLISRDHIFKNYPVSLVWE
ncbi:type II toxin-antitoxin system VapC family toxin [Algoriphagus sp. AK58]|uniref:type II toxin-antitoxin system VapC family toxin n=1 Tax=Algoriphagus sp. AK58 TaxID=1406877 RepID=UPI00164F8D45|nr:type II toxin-antitoxin system VapC family toxin [Algoriphagus sp. AK58]MBC6365843.1 PIN domain nuclease [Algoriphagus sp. AK58]